jgi:hypothetical protein
MNFINRWLPPVAVLIATAALSEAFHAAHVVRILSGGPDPPIGGAAVFLATPFSIGIGALLIATKTFSRITIFLASAYIAMSIYLLFEIARYMWFIDRVMHNFWTRAAEINRDLFMGSLTNVRFR